MRKLLLYVMTLSLLTIPLTGCWMFEGVDPTPAMETVQSLDADYVATLENFRAVIQQADMGEAERAEILNRLDNLDMAREEKVQSLMAFLESVGDIDWREMFQTVYDEYKTTRGD